MSSCCCYLITEITLQQNILEQISNINQNFWEVAQFTYSQHTHTHTHTHIVFLWFTGTLHRCNGFILYKLYVLLPYTYPTPKLSPHRRQFKSVWFISVLNYGDTENVFINLLLFVIPVSYPCHYTNLCPHKPHKHAHTTHPHTQHTHNTPTPTHREPTV